MKSIKLAIAIFWLCFFIFGAIAYSDTGTITLNPSTTYQTWKGWAATSWFCDELSVDDCPKSWPRTIQGTGYRMLLDLGVNIITIEITGMLENPNNYWATYLASGRTKPDLKTFRQGNRIYHAYDIVNDNRSSGDSRRVGYRSIDFSKFHFDYLDHKISEIVIPMKALVEGLGRPYYFYLKYVDFPRAVRTFNLCDDPNEYAEYILAIYKHIYDTYGFTPDGLDLINEPDNISNVPAGCWNSGTRLGNIIAAVGSRLALNGFKPYVVAPSTTRADRVNTYFDAIWAVTGARQYIREIGYHTYDSPSPSTLDKIGGKATKLGILSHMTEGHDSYLQLHKDIIHGKISVWNGAYTGIGTASSWWAWLYVTDATQTISVIPGIHGISQYSKYIRPGATRISATGDRTHSPVAFINPDGKYVAVIKFDYSIESFTVGGLPAGTYGISYSISGGVWNQLLTDQTITAGQNIRVNCKQVSGSGAGVATVYQKSSPSLPGSISGGKVSGGKIQ